MTISSTIKQNDMFGHSIKLNYNLKGDSHHTLIGGLFSILVRLCLALYVLMNFKKMILREEDRNFTEIGVDFQDAENPMKVRLNETSLD